MEFMQAMHEYKQRSGRMFPTWSEVLEVLQGLGYEKAEPPASPIGPPRPTAGGRDRSVDRRGGSPDRPHCPADACGGDRLR